MEWLLSNAVAALILPPGVLLVVLAIALYFSWRRPPLARALTIAAWLLLYALSVPLVAGSLLRLLEPDPRSPAADKSGQAIVILGGGTAYAAPEYGGDTVNALTFTRLRYGAHLHRAIRKPVLVSGGAPSGDHVAEARMMRDVLQNEFHVPVAWIEDGSRTTLENARASAHVLKAAGITRIYLVTHAWHMRRARYAFETAGFSVIPAATAFSGRPTPIAFDFVPSAQALLHSSWFVHEVIGLCWYHLRIAFGR